MPRSKKIFILNEYITNKNIEIGDYTYYYSLDGEMGARDFQNKNILYHFPDIYGDKLVIGKYCAIAHDVKFIMNGGNHRMDSFSSFPFEMFDSFKKGLSLKTPKEKGDTIVGHDVWIGLGATIMPGITIGNGAIIGAMSVVTRDVEPYSIVAGNPAKQIKKRFSTSEITALQMVKWWDKTHEELLKLIPELLNKTNW